MVNDSQNDAILASWEATFSRRIGLSRSIERRDDALQRAEEI